MFLWARKKVVVSLADGTALAGTTLLSVRSVRLRDVEYSTHGEVVAVTGRVIVPSAAILTVQVMP